MTQETWKLKKLCLHALSCLYIAVKESVARDVQDKVIAYTSALEHALASALAERDSAIARRDRLKILLDGVIARGCALVAEIDRLSGEKGA